jgi:glycosyltransferase involved in cell wall biosynthesis
MQPLHTLKNSACAHRPSPVQSQLKPVISFIVPAHNEQACLRRTLLAIHQSARAVGQSYEIIVVDDASTDATAQIARQHDATVVAVKHRQIAATRNSGARAARGDRFFFIDADTIINPPAVAAALRAMDKGAVGGGAPAWFDKHEVVPLYIRLIGIFALTLPKLLAFSGGAFMFCTRDAFHATGGFNERVYWGEEGSFALALKREGRFVGLWERVTTSGRRFRKISGLQLVVGGLRLLSSPFKMFTHRSSVEKVWYDSDRTGDDTMPNSFAVRLSNGIALLLLLVVLSGPLWNFVPRSLTPLASPVGKIRFAIGTFNCHVGLLFWPIAIVLAINLLRQKRFAGSIQSLALIALCLWLAFDATRGVIRVWTLFAHWLTHF